MTDEQLTALLKYLDEISASLFAINENLDAISATLTNHKWVIRVVDKRGD